MDLVAGAGGLFGQLAVGLAGGIPGGENNVIASGMNMAGKLRAKPTIDSLPDKASVPRVVVN